MTKFEISPETTADEVRYQIEQLERTLKVWKATLKGMEDEEDVVVPKAKKKEEDIAVGIVDAVISILPQEEMQGVTSKTLADMYMRKYPEGERNSTYTSKALVSAGSGVLGRLFKGDLKIPGIDVVKRGTNGQRYIVYDFVKKEVSSDVPPKSKEEPDVLATIEFRKEVRRAMTEIISKTTDVFTTVSLAEDVSKKLNVKDSRELRNTISNSLANRQRDTSRTKSTIYKVGITPSGCLGYRCK